MRLITLLFYIIIVIIGVTFAVLNAENVEVNFYFTQLTLPISLLITFVLGIGIIAGILLFVKRYLKLKRHYKQVKHELILMEKEVKNLRAIPLKDQH